MLKVKPPKKEDIIRNTGDYAIALALLLEIGGVYFGLKLAYRLGIVHTTNRAMAETSDAQHK